MRWGTADFSGSGCFNPVKNTVFYPSRKAILFFRSSGTGFLGVVLLFAVIGFVVYRGFRIANRCGNFYGYMLVCGITLAFAVQSALNALVVSGSIPPTGLPLPLISAGNTSLVVTMAGMGIVYGVSRHNGR